MSAGEAVTKIDGSLQLPPECRLVRVNVHYGCRRDLTFPGGFANQKVLALRVLNRSLFNLPHESLTVVYHNLEGSSALDRLHLIPIQANITGRVVRLDEQQAVFQALYLPSEMVAIVHDNHVLSSCQSWTTEECQERHEEEKTAHTGERKNWSSHSSDSYDCHTFVIGIPLLARIQLFCASSSFT